jgi:hypothetical protein
MCVLIILLLSSYYWVLCNPMEYLKPLQRQTDELIEENNEMPDRLQVPHVLLLEK